ncbi:MAG: penicillin-binding protein 1A [Rickettsiaceae bacterium]
MTKFILYIAYFILLLLCSFVLLVVGVVYYYSKNLPDYSDLLSYKPPSVTRIYSRYGTLIGEYARENRVFIPISAIPQSLINAFIAAEDKNFYHHPGVDILGITRSLFHALHQLMHNRRVGSGSTITQQVVKNFLLTPTRSFERKVKEIILAYRISNSLTKDQVLELYLNQTFFGKNSYGVATAALSYFNKSLDELNVAETAFLAGLPKAPSLFNPIRNYDRSKERRDYVINRMHEDGYITNLVAQESIDQPIILNKRNEVNNSYGKYYAEHVRKEVINLFGEDSFYQDGMTIITNLDDDIQKAAKDSLVIGIDNYSKSHPDKSNYANHLNGAIMVVNPTTGQVYAMQGGRDFNDSKFNRATQALRQPGSLIKSFIYLAALENSISPNTILTDERIEIEQAPHLPLWIPKNFYNDFLGDITMRTGLEKSRNIIPIKLTQAVGLSKIMEIFKRFGINSSPKPLYSVALGALETTLERMMRAYSICAHSGYNVNLKYIAFIKDRNGKTIYCNKNTKCIGCTVDDIDISDTVFPQLLRKASHSITDEASNYQLTSMLTGAVKRGTGQRAKILSKVIAGKTGTTNDSMDSWFIGFTPLLVVGTYIGYDIPKTLGQNASGATIALPIFVDVMKKIYRDTPSIPFIVPDSIKLLPIDKNTGIITFEESNPDIIIEAFKAQNIPSINNISNEPDYRDDNIIKSNKHPIEFNAMY